MGSHGFISEETVSFVSVTLFEVAFKGMEAIGKMDGNQGLISIVIHIELCMSQYILNTIYDLFDKFLI